MSTDNEVVPVKHLLSGNLTFGSKWLSLRLTKRGKARSPFITTTCVPTSYSNMKSVYIGAWKLMMDLQYTRRKVKIKTVAYAHETKTSE